MSVFKKALEEDPEESFSLSKSSKHSHINHMYDRLKNQSNQRVFESSTKTLLENSSNLDPYGYDSYFDQINAQRKKAESMKKQDKSKPRYINSLLDASEKRKRERSIVYEKMAEKELKNDELSKEKRFITESYKQVLEANRKFQYEDDEKEKYNAKNGIEGKQDLSAIYRTMFRENVFHGGERVIEGLAQSHKTANLEKRDRERSRSTSREKKKIQENEKKERIDEKISEKQINLELKSVETTGNKDENKAEIIETDKEKPKQDNTKANKEGENREEKLASARERYLNRKSKPQNENNIINPGEHA